MADVKVEWFGWYKNDEENSDKVWGWLNVNGNLYNFWAKRGKRIAFKQHADAHDFRKLCREKRDKGYVEIPQAQIEQVYEDFFNKVQRHLFNAKMTDKVK